MHIKICIFNTYNDYIVLKVERKKISCKDTEVIKKYPACLKDEKKISSSVENAQPPHQKSNGPALRIHVPDIRNNERNVHISTSVT